jgi:hypothetical protein
MKSQKSRTNEIRVLRKGLFFVLCVILCNGWAAGQATEKRDSLASGSDASLNAGSSIFRVEKISVDGGADLITILARRPASETALQSPGVEIPLISVLKDTLGDTNPDNDRLRYVWLHSYTRPSFRQRAAAFVPFLYSGSSSRKLGSDPPPTVIDLDASNKVIWHKLFWYLFKRMVVNELSVIPKASALQYRYNSVDLRRSAVADSIAALALFQEVEGEKILSDSELMDLQAKLSLSDKVFGWKMQSENLHRVFEQDRKLTRDFRGHNWELLRQYTEAQGLYFDPLVMPDGFARHAIVWTTESDVKANKGRTFNRRFLNIKNPWDDERLRNWKGYTQIRWFDSDDRQVDPGTPGAVAKTMIPLALYGLDHPKVPMILVDFRDAKNPKYRELSRRVLLDVTDNILAISQFQSLPYFLGRFVYDFVTGRRGMDLNQASRFRSYSQLRLLLEIDDTLDPEFRREVSKRVNTVSTNPLGNEVEDGSRIASTQYANLLAYAGRPDGLAKTIADDRREEMVPLKHSRLGQAFFSAANVVTLGMYTHREKESPQLLAQLDSKRQLAFHERFLREVAANSAGPEIDTDMGKLRESLNYLASNGDDAEVKTTRALARIYAISTTEDLRLLCLTGLYKVNNSSAKRELLAIYKASKPSEKSHDVSARYLKRALEEGKRISSRDVSSIAAITELTAN